MQRHNYKSKAEHVNLDYSANIDDIVVQVNQFGRDTTEKETQVCLACTTKKYN